MLISPGHLCPDQHERYSNNPATVVPPLVARIGEGELPSASSGRLTLAPVPCSARPLSSAFSFAERERGGQVQRGSIASL